MSDITRLLRLMDEQHDNYERLHDLLAKKRAAIEVNDLQALARAAHDIERLIGQNNQVEEQRQTAAGELAKQVGLRDAKPTVARLLRRLPEEPAGQLTASRDRLTATMKELRAESYTIQSVLGLNLQLIDDLVRALLSGVSDLTTYEADGASAAPRSMRLLDHTA